MNGLHPLRQRSYHSVHPLCQQFTGHQPPLTAAVNCHRRISEIWTALVESCNNTSDLNILLCRIQRSSSSYGSHESFHWNLILRSYSRLGRPKTALRVFTSMLRAGVLPDSFTLPASLKAAASAFSPTAGHQLHGSALRVGLEKDEFTESGLISLYCKAGEFDEAHKVFDENPSRKLGSWNALLCGFSQGGLAREAVAVFLSLGRSGLVPDDVTAVSVNSACGALGDLRLAFQLHRVVFNVTSGGGSDIQTLNSAMDMYFKCGRRDLAERVFGDITRPNVSSWTTLIGGYVTQGSAGDALACFRRMVEEARVPPNHVTFVGVLSACVHGGMVEEGRRYFDMMEEYGIEANLQHYGCLVDLLGKAGLVEEAWDVIVRMPMPPNVVILGSLMGACEKYDDVVMGERVAERLRRLEPWNDGAYVVLSNIYASKGMWEEVDKVRGVMKECKLEKVPAYSLTTTHSN